MSYLREKSKNIREFFSERGVEDIVAFLESVNLQWLLYSHKTLFPLPLQVFCFWSLVPYLAHDLFRPSFPLPFPSKHFQSHDTMAAAPTSWGRIIWAYEIHFLEKMLPYSLHFFFFFWSARVLALVDL